MSEPRDDRWDVVFADPSKKVMWQGRKMELLEGPRWHGCTRKDVETHHCGLKWVGQTVVFEPGFPHRNVLLRGVVESILPAEGEFAQPKAVVRFQVLEHFVRRTVPVQSLQLYPDAPPETPALNPLMEQDRLKRAKAAA